MVLDQYTLEHETRIDETWIDSDRPSGAALFFSDIELPLDAIYSDILP